MKHVLLIMGFSALAVQALQAAEPMTDEEVALQFEYNQHVLRMDDTAASHVQLAKWCQEHGLLDQAKGHLESALLRDPENVEAQTSLRALQSGATTEGDSHAEAAPLVPDANEATDLIPPWKLSDSAPPTVLPETAPDKTESKTFSETGASSDRRGAAPGYSGNKQSAEMHAPCLYIPAVIISIAGFIWVLAHVLAWQRRRALFRAINMSGVDTMNGHDFENYVAWLLRRQGWSIHEVTPGSGDLGVDIVASKRGVRYAVQAKRHSQNVAQDAVREVVAGMPVYKCTASMVVTNNYFSPSARRLAAANRCLLVDRDKLARWIAGRSN